MGGLGGLGRPGLQCSQSTVQCPKLCDPGLREKSGEHSLSRPAVLTQVVAADGIRVALWQKCARGEAGQGADTAVAAPSRRRRQHPGGTSIMFIRCDECCRTPANEFPCERAGRHRPRVPGAMSQANDCMLKSRSLPGILASAIVLICSLSPALCRLACWTADPRSIFFPIPQSDAALFSSSSTAACHSVENDGCLLRT